MSKKKINFASDQAIDPESQKPDNPFTIHNLERAISLLRKETGEHDLRQFVAEIISEFKQKEVSRKKDFDHYKEKFLEMMRNKYTKRALRIVGSFLALYIIFNIPIYSARLGWAISKPEKKTVITQEVQQRPMDKSAALETGEAIPSASTLAIQKINITAPIKFVESPEESAVQAGLREGVVRYAGTADPGEVGNVFITGHSSNYWWEKGGYNYVFVLLDKLEVGDKAKIYHGGNKYVYETISKQIVEPTDTSSLIQTDEPILTLMTCYPPGSNSKRMIVRLKQVEPQYHAPKIVNKEKTVITPKSLPTSDKSLFGGLLSFLWPF